MALRSSASVVLKHTTASHRNIIEWTTVHPNGLYWTLYTPRVLLIKFIIHVLLPEFTTHGLLLLWAARFWRTRVHHSRIAVTVGCMVLVLAAGLQALPETVCSHGL